ncbi:efflux RND transporter periplasmic adaptor subunit [Bradyrhizobium erythrophlei]|uniref:efflux RND transporter periplasmic adaptor subunit n=1 Tax=Bradyrhizobium erythrophlei TaxID=1437360 RepID=UPI0035EAC3C2
MRIFAGALLLIVFAAIAGFLDGGKMQHVYITVPVERGTVKTVIKATGVLNPVVMIEVGSQLSGRISEVLVNFNDVVKAGQVIARVDPEAYIAAVKKAKAALKIAKATAELQQASLQRARAAVENARIASQAGEADLAAAQAKQEEAERDVQRNTVLSRKLAISDREFTASRAVRDAGAAGVTSLRAQLRMKNEAIAIAEAELSMAEANVANAEGVVEQNQAALEQAEVDLQYTQIRSPIDGVVITRVINSGQTVAVSLVSKMLFKIADDLRVMQVEGKIDEADIGQVKEGQPATFTVDAYPDQTFSGRVAQVRKSPELSQSVVTYTAVISAPNRDYLLFPGMTARLSIVVGETGAALKVPNAALRFRPQSHASDGTQSTGFRSETKTVWVERKSGEVQPVTVTIGKSDDSGTQILSGGLTQGDPVIIGTSDRGQSSILPTSQ